MISKQIFAWIFFIVGVLAITSAMSADYNNRHKEDVKQSIESVDNQNLEDIRFSIEMSRME